MKSLIKIVSVVLISSLLVSCMVTTENHNHRHARKMPPGQAKKYYGGNARDYAPGHNKHNKRHHH